MEMPCTWKYQVTRLPAIMPNTMPTIVMVMDSKRSIFVNRPGVVPTAMRTPNSFLRSNTAMRKVFRILKATTTIRMTYRINPLTRSS